MSKENTPTNEPQRNSEVDYLREALRKRIEWDKEKLEQLVNRINREEAKLKEMGEEI